MIRYVYFYDSIVHGACKYCISYDVVSCSCCSSCYSGYPLYKHGTIIRTGITSKKIPCYMRDLAYRWFIVKKDEIFYYVKYF